MPRTWRVKSQRHSVVVVLEYFDEDTDEVFITVSGEAVSSDEARKQLDDLQRSADYERRSLGDEGSVE